ncbi:MAG: tetratricopeptide repeat protein [Bryobacter sp.]|nr:tetratricopeptide repeat protein [Bryobacter sp.]
MLLLLLAPLLAQPNLLEQAKQAREANQLSSSNQLLRRHLATNPGSNEAWWYLGLNAYDADNFPACAEAFGKVFAAEANNGGAAAFLGLCEFRLGQYEKAFSHLALARRAGLVAETELEKVAHFHYLMLLNKIGQFEMAAGLLAEAARSTPEMPFLLEMCGIATLRLSKLPMEIVAAEAEPISLAGRACLLAFQRRPGEAKPPAEELLAKYPKLPNAHYLRGYLALLEQDPKCIDYFAEELTVSPNHIQARLQIAYEWLKRGEAARGLPYAAEAAKLAPKDFTAHNIHGRLLLETEAYAAAASALEQAVVLAPNSPEAHFHLASAYNRLGRKAEAQKHREIFATLDKQRKR